MVLTPQDVEEMVALVHRLERGSVSRNDWSQLCALTVLAQPASVIAAIPAQGLDEFIRISTPIWEGHGFHYADYRRIYDRICAALLRSAPTGGATH